MLLEVAQSFLCGRGIGLLHFLYLFFDDTLNNKYRGLHEAQLQIHVVADYGNLCL